ncbi:MAG: hypothetical protein RLZZ505_2611 [Verrucomicrobiota bacterium]|jgi:hypothetical protein
MNPILGVFYHWLGGVAAGSFYVPFRGVKSWSWETAWMIAGVFSWIVAPWFFAILNTTDALTALKESPGSVMLTVFLLGVAWGFGGLTFGLAIRYLGMSLGVAVALGYCTVFGTLIPPLINGVFVEKLIEPANGRWVLAGLFVCVVGIAVTALAGKAKEGGEAPETMKDFNLKKGILVASFSGIMSACFAFALNAGDPIREITLKLDMANSAASAGVTVARSTEPSASEMQAAGITEELLEGMISKIEESSSDGNPWQGSPESESSPLAARIHSYAETLAGIRSPASLKIITNLNSFSEKETAANLAVAGADLPAIHEKHVLWSGLPVLIVIMLGGFMTNFIWCVVLNIRNRTAREYVSVPGESQSIIPLARNYIFAALAGVIWYFQFFFYSMGESQMGEYKFSSWTLHMASIIIFSSVWGLALREWKGAGHRARRLLFAGLAILILSTVIVGYGNYVESGFAH